MKNAHHDLQVKMDELSKRMDNLADEIKQRETSLFAATRTFLREAALWKRG